MPMLAHSLFKKQLANKTVQKEKQPKQEHGKMANAYKGILNWTLNHKVITFGAATIILVLSFFIVPIIGTDFLAEEEEKMVIATYSPEPGQTKEQSEEIVFNADDLIGDRNGVTTYQFSLGGGNPMTAMMGGGSDNSALFFIEYEKDFKNFKDEQTALIDKLNETSKMSEWKSMDFSGMSGGLELYVYGDKLNDIEDAVNKIIPIVEDNKDTENVETSITEAYDQYTLVVDQKKLSKNGLTAAQIGMELNQTDDTNVFTTIEHDGKDVNVYVETEKDSYDSIKDMTKKKVMTPLGKSVKIADLVEVKEGKAPETIDRRDGKMYASISADITAKDTGGVTNTIDKEIDKP